MKLSHALFCCLFAVALGGCGRDEGFPGSAGAEVGSETGRDANAFPKKLFVVRFGSDAVPRSMEYTIDVLQGLVNDEAPRLYVVDEDSEDFWLGKIKKDFGTELVETRNLRGLFALDFVKKAVKGLIVIGNGDAKLTINNAVMIAAQKKALVVRAEHLSLFRDELGYSVLDDLRGRWAPTPEGERSALAWAVNHMLPVTNTKTLGMSRGDFYGRMKGIDHYVAKKMFVLHVDSSGVDVGNTLDLQEKVLKKFDPLSIVVGMWSKEVKDIGFLSRHKLTRVGSGQNMTIFEHVPARPAGSDPVDRGTARRVVDGESYVYLSFTQGDALEFCSKNNLRQMIGRLANGRLAREVHPFGIMHTPIQGLYQPYIMHEIQKMASGGVAAKPFGYANPTTLNKEGVLDEYLQRGRNLLQKAGIRDVMINDKNLDGSREVLRKYVKIVEPRSILFKHDVSEDELQTSGEPYLVEGVPVFPNPAMAKVEKNDRAEQMVAVRNILESARRRQFFWVFLDHSADYVDVDAIVEGVRSRNNKIKFLNLDDFTRTYRRHARGE